MCGRYLLGDMLSAICNRHCFYEKPVKVDFSGLSCGVLDVMKQCGYIKKYDVIDTEGKKSINIWLQLSNGVRNINTFKLISKPGRRIYAPVRELKKKISYNPFMLLLVSTAHGVMNATDAVQRNFGGEVLCEIF